MGRIVHRDRNRLAVMAAERCCRFAPTIGGQLSALTQAEADLCGFDWAELRLPCDALNTGYILSMTIGQVEHTTDTSGILGDLAGKTQAAAIATGLLDPTPVAVKADGEKPRMGLIDPAFAEAMAKVLTFGEQKYATADGSSNWRIAPGLGVDRVLDAAERHIKAIRSGEDLDPETGLPHTAHAACCMMMVQHYLSNTDEFKDDRRWKETYGRHFPGTHGVFESGKN